MERVLGVPLCRVHPLEFLVVLEMGYGRRRRHLQLDGNRWVFLVGRSVTIGLVWRVGGDDASLRSESGVVLFKKKFFKDPCSFYDVYNLFQKVFSVKGKICVE